MGRSQLAKWIAIAITATGVRRSRAHLLSDNARTPEIKSKEKTTSMTKLRSIPRGTRGGSTKIVTNRSAENQERPRSVFQKRAAAASGGGSEVKRVTTNFPPANDAD